MKYATLAILACTLWSVSGYPYHYGNNRDTLSHGSQGNGHSSPVLSRYYNPSLNSRTHASVRRAALVINAEDQRPRRFYQPDRRRQVAPESYSPQENDVYYTQEPSKPLATELTDIAEPLPTEIVETPSTIKAALPELTEPKVETVEEPLESRDLAPAPKKRISKKKPVKKPVEEEEEEDEEEETPRMPTGAFFPMFFGWGRGRSSGAPNGATAIANAFSTGRGGVATSDATAYGPPRPEIKPAH